MIGVVFSSFDHINCLYHITQERTKTQTVVIQWYGSESQRTISSWYGIVCQCGDLSSSYRQTEFFIVGWWKIDILIEVFSGVFGKVFLFSDSDATREGNAEGFLYIVILIHEFILSHPNVIFGYHANVVFYIFALK